MFVARHIYNHLREMVEKYPVVSLTGPRQAGKTTLLQNQFKEFRYVNLERIDIREMISADPVTFLKGAGPHVIFDEAQSLPDLFSYIQAISDERKVNGQFILSGSQSFLLNNHISQSLAGRVSVNVLLPFDISELLTVHDFSPSELIIKGFYPRLHDNKIAPSDFYPSYLQTYIERDIRTLRSVENLHSFARFLSLCAGRTGQILNLSSLASDAGIAVNTAKAWLSLLESSYIVFLLQPYYKNFNKRIIKSPKIYFYDTGIVASLLRISDADMLHTHYLYGALFENLVISEIVKAQLHKGQPPAVYYWRESNGSEIDCLIEKSNGSLNALEIKAGGTFNKDYSRNLKLFPASDKETGISKYIVYNGTETGMLNDIMMLNWNSFARAIDEIA